MRGKYGYDTYSVAGTAYLSAEGYGFFTGARSLAEHRRTHWLASHVSIATATLFEDLP